MSTTRAIFRCWPQLDAALRFVVLGDLPTPVESLEPLMKAVGFPQCSAWIKRDDRTSLVYGGNKVRTLEVLFALAKAQSATHVWATGAYGSNHAVATMLHAPRVGLEAGALLFPQPHSAAALSNLRVTLGQEPTLYPVLHWSTLPFKMFSARKDAEQANVRPYVMVPGGATPEGAMGYVSAALELAYQVEEGQMPAPRAIVVGAGSTCTSAGLLVGLHHATRLGIGFQTLPKLIAARVTPWPVTSPLRIAWLAYRTAQHLAQLANDPSLAIPWRTLYGGLEVDRRYLGAGYGKITRTGTEAIELFETYAGLKLDTTYSGKSGAALLGRVRSGERGPLLYWATKSSVPLPEVSEQVLRSAPAPMRRWMEKASARLV